MIVVYDYMILGLQVVGIQVDVIYVCLYYLEGINVCYCKDSFDCKLKFGMLLQVMLEFFLKCEVSFLIGDK